MLVPAAIVSGDAGANVPVLDVVLSATVNALLVATGLPKESSKAAVIVPEAVPAVKFCGAVVNAKRLAAAGLTVSCCVAERRPGTP